MNPMTPAEATFELTEQEKALVALVAPQHGEDPSTYVAVQAIARVDDSVPGQINEVRDLQGRSARMVIMQMHVLVPMAILMASGSVLGADGAQSNPIAGFVPVLECRLVLPRARLRAHSSDQRLTPALRLVLPDEVN